MTNLSFIKPLRYKDFLTTQFPDANCEGIYIWGFNCIQKEGNNDKGEQLNFIPYYVGKSLSSIYKRIIEHFTNINFYNTYMIFNEEFYKILPASLSDFRIRKAHPGKWVIKYIKKDLIYLNDDVFLDEYEKEIDAVDYKKGVLKKGILSQTIDFLIKKNNSNGITIQKTIDKVFTKDNLYVTYAKPTKDENDITNYNDSNLEKAETFVKFCLINNTIGKSKSLETIKNNPFIKISSDCHFLRSIFHQMPNNNVPTVEIQIKQNIYKYNGYC